MNSLVVTTALVCNSDLSTTCNKLFCSGGTIVLNILPSDGDEEEKTFTVNLLSASNDVVVDPTRQSVAITVAQRGMPYGTIGFFGDVIQLHKVDEGVGSQDVVFPIARSAPALGDVEVAFTVTGETLFCVSIESLLLVYILLVCT